MTKTVSMVLKGKHEAFYMGKCSTAELHLQPLPLISYIKFGITKELKATAKIEFLV